MVVSLLPNYLIVTWGTSITYFFLLDIQGRLIFSNFLTQFIHIREVGVEANICEVPHNCTASLYRAPASILVFTQKYKQLKWKKKVLQGLARKPNACFDVAPKFYPWSSIQPVIC